MGWNLNHFNDSFDENVIETIANTIYKNDLIYLLEVSCGKTRPDLEGLARLLESKRRINEDSEADFAILETLMTKQGGGYGVVLYNKKLVKLESKDVEVKWSKYQLIHHPVIHTFSILKKDTKTKWNFTVAGIHLKSGNITL